MGNHVIRDRIWESNKLRHCSKAAAMAYPWIFLVADDHGRFEYNPRRIWTRVFGSRDDVTLDEVTSWLDEYWKAGLLVRYHIDGDLAMWVGFKGRKMSERRNSDIVDPEGFPPFLPNELDPLRDKSREGAENRGAPRQIDSRAEIEQSRDRTESETERPANVRAKSRKVKAVSADFDTAPNRSLIDAYNTAFRTAIGYVPGNLRAAARTIADGYSIEHCKTVFEAVKGQSTVTAKWCFENNREFEYLIRPAYKHSRTQELVQGPLDKIPNELATGRKQAS